MTQGQFLSGVQLVWTKFSFSLAYCLTKTKETQSASLFIYNWNGNNWIHAFPKGISVKWNANSLIQYSKHYTKNKLCLCLFVRLVDFMACKSLLGYLMLNSFFFWQLYGFSELMIWTQEGWYAIKKRNQIKPNHFQTDLFSPKIGL